MSLKVVHFNCCGMDVHKNVIVATIGVTDPSTLITEYHQRSFSTYNCDLIQMADWLSGYDCSKVCMESTGKYWIPVFNILESRNFEICLVHPKYTKAIKGKKTDKKDSKWICDLYKYDLVKSSFIPPKEIRELREIARYYYKLIEMNSSESNRFQNCMTISNIGLGSALSDPMGSTGMKIMDELLNSDNVTDEKILKLIHGGCKNKDKILEAVRNSNISSDARFKLKEIQKHKTELDQHITACLTEMYVRAVPLLPQFQHITEMKGISSLSAILIISEIGVNMNIWDSGKQLCSWAGLVPGNNESANKKKSVRITKAGQYLKPLLVQCALSAIKDKKGYFGIKYYRIRKRRGHKKAIIAIARMMLICIYHMILTGESFHPSDYEELMNPKPRKPKEYTIESAMDFLVSSGVDLDTIITAYKQAPPAQSPHTAVC